MASERKLSSVSQVVVAARVSRSGQAAARTGDLEGQSRPVSPATQNVEVVIDREVR
jgi:cytochrome c-type biogenesis protein CcmH